MTFDLQLINLPPIHSIDTDDGRIYEVDGNRYWSVTTVLGRMADQSYLEIWRNNIGNEEADRLTRLAGSRGSAVHDILEQYVRGNPDYLKGAMPFNKASVKPFIQDLDSHVTKVILIEAGLFSKRMKIAGRSDLVCYWDGELAVVDYKTSMTFKREGDIHDYFLQKTMYSMMLFEMVGLRVTKIVTLIDSDGGAYQRFEKRPSDYIGEVLELVKSHHKKFALPK